MTPAVRRLATRLGDAARYSRLGWAAQTARHLAAAAVARTPAGELAALTRAYRTTWWPWLERRLKARLDRAAARAPWPFSAPPRAFTGGLYRSLILKPPLPGGERGVLLLTAEWNWNRLAASPEAVAHVGERYDLIVSAGWSSTDYAALGRLGQVYPGRVFVEAANRAEHPKLVRFDRRLVPVPTICCDWIDPTVARVDPRGGRTTDLLMVANWAPFKRHWHLFGALRGLPADLRVTLIGQPDGPYTLARVRRQLADAAPPQRVEILESVPVATVAERMADARAFVILSRHEGTCVSVCEALMADTPVGMLYDAHIGSRDYINPQTGALLPYRRLGPALADLVARARAGAFNPRAWAVEHISAPASYRKLNATLKEQAAKDGRPWTTDLARFLWRPYCLLADPADAARLAPALGELIAAAPGLFNESLVDVYRPGT